jgi:hypothetical protein
MPERAGDYVQDDLSLLNDLGVRLIAEGRRVDAVLVLSARDNLASARAECERHRRANLVRSVINGWNEDIDGALTDYINEHGWDAVPWKVAEGALGAATDGR